MPVFDDARWEVLPDGSRRRRKDMPPDSDSGVNATDAAVAKANELGIDISLVAGTGKGGRVSIKDVEAASQA